MCIVVALGLCAGFAGSAAARAHGAVLSTGSGMFTDPAGDAQSGAPDITAATVGGDPASGTVTVAVTATGYVPASPDGMERDVLVFLDTDKNESTGSPCGCEYVLVAWNDSTGAFWDIQRWDGSAWQSVPQSATMSASRNGDVITWRVNASDLGGATGFGFYVAAIMVDASHNVVGRDFAPDAGKWPFDIAGGAAAPAPAPATSAPTKDLTYFLTPKIGKPASVPASPLAGKRLTLSFSVTRSDDQKPLASGKMIAVTSIAGKVIPHTQSFVRGVARLSFVVPKTAKGKLLQVKLTIKAPSYQGQDGTYIEIASGQTGTIHTWYSGQSATRIINLRIR
jgi:hypothetical protein